MSYNNELTIDKLSHNENNDDFLLEMYRKINQIVDVVNYKDTAIYSNDSFYMAGRWYINQNPNDPAPLTRKVISFGALPNSTTKSVAHEINNANPITADWIVIPIGGRSFNPTTGRTIPIFNPNLNITIDYTNINITTLANYSEYTTTEIIVLFTTP